MVFDNEVESFISFHIIFKSHLFLFSISKPTFLITGLGGKEMEFDDMLPSTIAFPS